MASKELTGLRDESRISERHRLYGHNAPVMDLDSVWLEFERRRPCCLIDYKHPNWSGTVDERAVEPMVILADNSSIPAFIAQYFPDWSYRLYPLNSFAKAYVKGEYAHVTEKRFCAFRWHLGGRKCPQDILDQLNG